MRVTHSQKSLVMTMMANNNNNNNNKLYEAPIN